MVLSVPGVHPSQRRSHVFSLNDGCSAAPIPPPRHPSPVFVSPFPEIRRLDVRSTYDEKLERILRASATVFAEKGYDRASVRDIAAVTGVSLSGLYYYFKSKEELLFLIQHHCFRTILEHLRAGLAGVTDAEARLRIAIRNHLRFFVGNMKEMKVLSHEAEVLTGEYREEVGRVRREYTGLVQGIVAELGAGRPVADARTATYALFGMLNWIYKWYRPERDIPVERLAAEMTHLFLRGYLVDREEIGPPGPGEDGAGSADPAVSIWGDP